MELSVEDSKSVARLYDPTTEGSYWYVMQTPRMSQECEMLQIIDDELVKNRISALSAMLM